MSRSLNVIYPGEIYVEGGTPTDVDLSCTNESGKILPVKLSQVLLQIVENDPLAVQEINSVDEDHNFSTDVIYATKIYNPCTEEATYVTDYINDVLPFVGCCGTAGVSDGGGCCRFGIEDIEGVQDRSIDMDDFYLHITNLKDLSLSKGDNSAYIGIESEITLGSGSVGLYTQVDADNMSQLYVGNGANTTNTRIIDTPSNEFQTNQIASAVQSDSDTDNIIQFTSSHTTGSLQKISTLSIKPREVILNQQDNTANIFRILFPFRDESTDYYVPISLNGHVADSTGKISVGALEFTDNADAIANGLVIGNIYRTGDVLKIVH